MDATSSSCGVLLVDKPSGLTSHDVVEETRSRPEFAGAKVGHSGTLDPFASGLLVLLVGRATRCARYFTRLEKSYRARVRFGARSTTQDPEGEITADSDGSTVTSENLLALLGEYTGEVIQKVPMVSAVKVDGERLYHKARRGETVETPVRRVRVERLELREFDSKRQTATLDVVCSSGTYIRQLAADIGERVGAGAYCTELRRTAVGAMTVDQADPKRLLDLSLALDFLPEQPLNDAELRRAANGASVPAIEAVRQTHLVRLTHGRQLVAVAERAGSELRPVTVLGAG